MAVIKILSAGAAQAVVEKIAADYSRDTGDNVEAEFSAVGAMKQRVVAGEPVDVIVLTGVLVDERIASSHIAPGTRSDLGKVGTGVAVRTGTPAPDVSSAESLRSSLRAASRVVCPDPATATAGKVVLRVLEQLGIVAQLLPRMQYFPNGYAAMKWMAESRDTGQIGITQVTEILANPGVAYVGELPGALQTKTLYSAGVGARAANVQGAKDFIGRLTSASARSIFAKAGYEFDG
jgi:molybdate transport system substrate-binding protein